MYIHVTSDLKQAGIEITEETNIKIYEGASPEELSEMEQLYGERIDMYQQIPITVIKSRALDELLAGFPDPNTIYNARSVIYSMSKDGGDKLENFFNKQMDIAILTHQYIAR